MHRKEILEGTYGLRAASSGNSSLYRR